MDQPNQNRRPYSARILRRGRNSPPGPSSWLFLLNGRKFMKNRANYLLSLHKTYGDIVRARIGLYEIYLINQPHLVKEALSNRDGFVKTPATRFLSVILGNGILVSEGDFHKRQRRLIQPAFDKDRFDLYGKTMTEAAARMAGRWRNDKCIELHTEMVRLTQEIIANTLFHAGTEDEYERVSRSLSSVLPIVNRIGDPLEPIKRHLPLAKTRRLRQSRRELDELIYGKIKDARSRREDSGDLLSMLVMAQDAEGNGKGMTDEQIRDEALTIYLAGHETTALGLTWTLYLLSQHREAEAKILHELETVLDGRIPRYRDLPRLSYTRSVITEALRLYPPVYLIGRITKNDWNVGDYVVPKGKYVFISPYTMHRNEKYFPDPERFDPERWTPEEIENRPKFSFFPFGGGSRICIGEAFAWMKMILVLATVLPRWSFELLPGQTIRLEPLVTLRPKKGIEVKLIER